MVVRQFFGHFCLRPTIVNNIQNFLYIVFLHYLSS